MKKFIKMLLALIAVTFSVNTVFGMDGQEVTENQIFVYFPHPRFLEIANTCEPFEDNETIFPYDAADSSHYEFSGNFELLSQSMYTTPRILYPAGNMPKCVDPYRNFIVLYPAFEIYDASCRYFCIKQSSELRAIAAGDTAAIGPLMREGRLVPLQVVNSQGGYWEYAKNVLNVRGEWCFSDAVIPDLCDVKKSFKQGTKEAFLRDMDEIVQKVLPCGDYNTKLENQARFCGVWYKACGLDGQEIVEETYSKTFRYEHIFILLDSSKYMRSRKENCMKIVQDTLNSIIEYRSDKSVWDKPFCVHFAMFNNGAIATLQNFWIIHEEDVEKFMQRVRDHYHPKNGTAMHYAVNQQVRGLLKYGDGTKTKLDKFTCIIIDGGKETVGNVLQDTMLQSLRSFIERDGSVFVIGVGDGGASMSETFKSLDGKFPERRFLIRSFSDEEVEEGDSSFHLSLFCFCRFKDHH